MVTEIVTVKREVALLNEAQAEINKEMADRARNLFFETHKRNTSGRTRKNKER